MYDSDQINLKFPELGNSLGKETLAALPTPVRTFDLDHNNCVDSISVKCDNLTGTLYGGNKVRKLEYALWPARARHRKRIATFGAIGSNHALATALYARSLGYDCICFLSHQSHTPGIRQVLAAHFSVGTKIVRYGGAYKKRLAILRKHLWNTDCWLIPAGGSSWLGTIGFVNAGLELAAQIRNGEIEEPQRIYIATGTMGSAIGLAIGLTLDGISCRVEAIRVSPTTISNDVLLRRLAAKTILMMRRLDPSVPADLENSLNIRMRHEFFADGYGRSNTETDAAIAVASKQMGLKLESTYTGKAMAALLRDRPQCKNESVLFWNTYNSADLPVAPDSKDYLDSLPDEFERYL